MKELDYFLKALSNRLSNHIGIFVPKSSCINTRFPAYKKHTLEVWLVNGIEKTQISNVIITARTVEDSEKEKIHSELITTTIENILKWYGI